MLVFESATQACLCVGWTETSGSSQCHLRCSLACLIKCSHLNCHYTNCSSFIKRPKKKTKTHKVPVTAAFKSICGWAARCHHSDTGTRSRLELVGESIIGLPEYAIQSGTWHISYASENCRTKLPWEHERRFREMIGFVNDARRSPMVTLAPILALIDQRGGNAKCAKWSQGVAGRWLGPGESSLLLHGSNFRVSLHPSPRTPLWPWLTSLICLPQISLP